MTNDEHDFQSGGGAVLASVQTTVDITEGKVWDQLTSAFEGGSNYWIHHAEKSARDQLTGKATYLQDWPLLGGYVTIVLSEDPGSKYRAMASKIIKVPSASGGEYEMPAYHLDRDALVRGLSVMREKYTRHWRDLVEETGDATTGDVYLQCCLFGEIVFG